MIATYKRKADNMMKNINIHDEVTPFEVFATGFKDIHLTKLDGWFVLLVEANESTWGLLSQLGAFYPRFKIQQCLVFGVSDQPLDELEQYKSDLQLPFHLISNAELLSLIKGADGECSAALIDDAAILRDRYATATLPATAREMLDEVKLFTAALADF